MTLNLPIADQLAPCQTVLIAGIGGGYDIFCGLPLRHTLRAAGKTVHLANLSFTNLPFVRGAIEPVPGLYGVQADNKSVLQYCPELHLARYLRGSDGDDAPIWCLGGEVAAQPLARSYRYLLETLNPDALLLVDGGVDSLMRGDEAEVGTVFEDAVSLAAVSLVAGAVPTYLACLGMGAENDITYAHVLENIAALGENGGFLGACAPTPAMPAFRAYEDAVRFVHDQKYQEPSIINSSLVSAVRGHFGNYHATERTRGSRLHLSPLMALCWFFDFARVAERCLLVPPLRETHTRREAFAAIAAVRSAVGVRSTGGRIL